MPPRLRQRSATNPRRKPVDTLRWWFFKPKRGRRRIVLEGPNDILIEKSLHFAFRTSNNQVKYKAILTGLSLAPEVGVKTLTCKTDSKLTVGHLNDEFHIKDPTLLQYYHLVRNVIQSAFERVCIQHIPRSENVRANILSKLASTKLKSRHRSLLQQTLSAPSTTNTCHNLTQHQADNWITPLNNYTKAYAAIFPAHEPWPPEATTPATFGQPWRPIATLLSKNAYPLEAW